jgi:biopolymer transport protein ExbD
MADKRRLLDVWVVETNTAYRAVPFETVANWMQQGRLLGEDRVRPAGTQDWYRIDAIPALMPYLPVEEPQRIEDEAEALEPVEAEFNFRRPEGADEDDPDMIPLIDITLVLLIFFMMTAAIAAGMFTPIDTPAAQHQLTTIEKNTYWVAVDRDPKTKELRFALGHDNKQLSEKQGPELAPVLTEFKGEIRKGFEELAQAKDPLLTLRVNVRADKTLAIETVKEITLELQHVEAEINAAQVREGKAGRLKLIIGGEVRAPKE